jgi:hypothetical protein
MASEQELLSQLEELRKKQKEMKEENKDAEFNKQRNFLIKIIRDFLEIEVSDAEVLAILYKYFFPQYLLRTHPHGEVKYYLKKEDENMLFERKVSNRYARYHEIRVEDSDMIIQNFVNKIQPIINYDKFNEEQQKKSQEHQKKQHEDRRKGMYNNNNYNIQYVPEKYVPLFC